MPAGPEGWKVLAAAIQEVVTREAERRQVEAPKAFTRFGYDTSRKLYMVKVEAWLGGRRVGTAVDERMESLQELSVDEALGKLGNALGSLYEELWPVARGEVIDVEAREVVAVPALGLRAGGVS